MNTKVGDFEQAHYSYFKQKSLVNDKPYLWKYIENHNEKMKKVNAEMALKLKNMSRKSSLPLNRKEFSDIHLMDELRWQKSVETFKP